MSIEVDLVFVMVQIDMISVWGILLDLISVWDELNLVVLWVVEIDFNVRGAKMTCFSVCMPIY